MTHETEQNFPRGAFYSFEHCSTPTVENIVFLRDELNIFCRQMMEMSRDVWKSSPNVIAHIEKEAKKHQLDDELRRKKVEQLKVSLFLINLILPVSNWFFLGFYAVSFRRIFSTKWNSTIFSVRWDECSAYHSI